LNLKSFINFYNILLQRVYKIRGWATLCQLAGDFKDFTSQNQHHIVKAIPNKWLSCSSRSYYQLILDLAINSFNVLISEFNEQQQQMLLMLHYDIWQAAGGSASLELSINEIGKNKVMVEEIIEVLELLIDRIDFKEIEIHLPYNQPLKVHARYTRDQILAAFRLSTFQRKSPSREGVAENSELNTELLFINLIKSEENFSPTTMYDDYAINETLFHWQSQNSAGPDTPKGLSYIKHKSEKKKILLFVREKNKDEYGNTMGYVFVGEGILKDHYGAKPMSIKWGLNEPMPHYLWKDAAKLRVG